MTYHRNLGGLGQDMTFSLTDPDVAAMQTPAPTTSTTRPTTTATTGSKTTAAAPSSTSGGKSGGGIMASWAPQPAAGPITSAAYAAGPPSDGTPHWIPWAIGGTVAVIGLGLIFAARS